MKHNYELLLIASIVACLAVFSGCKGGSSSKSEEQEPIYEYVDLGLPSGTKWATCNIGALGPYDCGKYFAWGEVTVKSDSEDLQNYKFYDKTKDEYSKYVNNSKYGSVDDKKVLESSDDVATKKWGEDWRMPTREELEELMNICMWKMTTAGGKKGFRVIGPSGYSIFLPIESSIYWTSSLASDPQYACCLELDAENAEVAEEWRYNRFAVRPVLQNAGTHSKLANVAKYEYYPDSIKSKSNSNEPAVDGNIDGYDYADLGLPSGLLWATCNVGAENPEDCGDYFAWGETKSKNSYKWGSYKFYKSGKVDDWYPEKTDITFTKYTNSDDKLLLDYSDDAATANWGKNWRMPTDVEFNELIEKCKLESIENDSLKGLKITGPNGHWIFLPKAGYQTWHGAVDVGNKCKYWSCTRDFDGFIKAYSYYVEMERSDRFEGMSVRPVVSGKSSVTTSAISGITANSAVCGGVVSINDDATVTARGVCWSESRVPIFRDSHTEDGEGAGNFSSNITGLQPNTTYYVRAYAVGDLGPVYGEMIKFTTTSNK